jgi:hypothetical protein
MTRQTTDADWITEGAKVAEYTRKGANARVSFTTVERLTATQIVCANGARYRRDTLGIVGGGRAELAHPAEQRVVHVVAAKELSSLRHRVDQMCKDHSGYPEAVLLTLADIEVAVAKVRTAITSLAEPDAARVTEGN